VVIELGVNANFKQEAIDYVKEEILPVLSLRIRDYLKDEYPYRIYIQ